MQFPTHRAWSKYSCHTSILFDVPLINQATDNILSFFRELSTHLKAICPNYRSHGFVVVLVNKQFKRNNVICLTHPYVGVMHVLSNWWLNSFYMYPISTPLIILGCYHWKLLFSVNPLVILILISYPWHWALNQLVGSKGVH